MKKQKLLITLGIIIVLTITVSACTSYSCPTYSDIPSEEESNFI